MRKPVKFRLAFLFVATECFCIGTVFLPETLPQIALTFDNIIAYPPMRHTAFITLLYFVFLPVLYYFWIIRIGEQALWKLLLVLSLSSLVARYTYPQPLTDYFMFISYLKYPFLAVLMIIEIVLIVSITRAIWGARNLSGDPRIHILEKFEGDPTKEKSKKEAKQLELALMFAHEPASWYYAIPWFSRNHSTPLANLRLWSGYRWHVLSVCLVLFIAAYASYLLLSMWHNTVALIVASLVFYMIIMFIANHRVSRHYSVYITNSKLMVNNSWWGISVIPLSNIHHIDVGCWAKTDTQAHFHFGKGEANVKIHFATPQRYFSAMGLLNEYMPALYLSIDDNETLTEQMQQQGVQVTLSSDR